MCGKSCVVGRWQVESSEDDEVSEVESSEDDDVEINLIIYRGIVAANWS